MAKNPFTSVSDVTRKIGKNYYDWSHDYNFTGKIGTIYPTFAKYCPAGTSLSIDAVAGLQFMPMQFPVQSKMKVKLSFWRMPLRAMWKDYTNLVSSQNQPDVQKNYVAPYIDFNHSDAYTDMLAVGGMCDYLRIPVVVRSSEYYLNDNNLTLPSSTGSLFQGFPLYNYGSEFSTPGQTFDQQPVGSDEPVTRGAYMQVFPSMPAPSVVPSTLKLTYTLNFPDEATCLNAYVALTRKFDTGVGGYRQRLYCTNFKSGTSGVRIVVGYYDVDLNITSVVRQGNSLIYTGPVGAFTGRIENLNGAGLPEFFLSFPFETGLFATQNHDVPLGLVYPIWSSASLVFSATGAVPVSKSTSPYFDSSNEHSSDQLKLSAYPFRMYEAIYNAYIRYIRNNPFKKDGKAVYNEWLPTMDGGADATPYKLHRCNWAPDAYTTAVQSPQQGVAPVVGLSQATLTGEDGVSRVVPAITTEDGKAYGLEYTSNEFGLTGVDYTELGTGAKVAPVHSMYSLAQSGISIEDFRMTNAYQRYLELNMMRGYSYKQIVEGRFEVNVKYDDLLMPEFCGGMTRDVFMSGVQQNVEDNGGSGTYVGSLGSEAGVAGCRGDLGHKIKIYCDEASYVMCLAYVVPQSIYSQTCPKDFLYRDLLDAWSPEFDQIGFQPIKKSELCPLQAWIEGRSALNDTFGFQRPWHEYCEVLDASVGLFNTELSNFLMHRTFNSVPILGEKFTTVNSESVDHVFSVTEFTDKFFGQIHFSIDVKSPVSRVVIPSLE